IEVHDLLDRFPTQARVEAIQPGQFLGAEDLHLVRVDRIEVAGKRRPPGDGLDRFQPVRRAFLSGDPAQFQALAELFEQLAGGDRRGHAALPRTSNAASASGSGAWRNASRKPASANCSASSDSSCRCCWVKCCGTAMANTRSTGTPSLAPKSTACDSRRKAARASTNAPQRPCGIATP